MSKFKIKHTFEQRKNEATKIRERYPNLVPVIVEKAQSNSPIPDVDKHKFLVPNDITVGQFIFIIRKRIKLTPEQGLFVFINNTIPPSTEQMSVIYKNFKDEDQFLYLVYSGESVFGDK